ncbi:MAG: hypothetical protein IKG27_05825 [Bacilli bacterium]|nr:hypothetical protein [Bacilli bacterium]
MKKLPKVFANKEVKTSGNNDDVYYSSHDRISDNIKKEENINQKINNIFNSPDYIYKADVNIELKSGCVTKRVVGKNSTHLITMENELIPISDIIDIKKTV